MEATFDTGPFNRISYTGVLSYVIKKQVFLILMKPILVNLYFLVALFFFVSNQVFLKYCVHSDEDMIYFRLYHYNFYL